MDIRFMVAARTLARIPFWRSTHGTSQTLAGALAAELQSEPPDGLNLRWYQESIDEVTGLQSSKGSAKVLKRQSDGS